MVSSEDLRGMGLAISVGSTIATISCYFTRPELMTHEALFVNLQLTLSGVALLLVGLVREPNGARDPVTTVLSEEQRDSRR